MPLEGGAKHYAFEDGFLCGYDYTELILGVEEALDLIDIDEGHGITVADYLKLVDQLPKTQVALAA